MREDIIEKYLEAGRIAAKVLKEVRDFVTPKKRIDLLEIAEYAESLTIKYGGMPAFPCNVDLNEVAAHYTPLTSEPVVFDEGLLKVDVGVHIDGYIADTAITIARGEEYIEMARVNEEVLNHVIDEIRPGRSLGELGRLIEEEVYSRGYKVISDLAGHLIDRYNLHAGKNFPNTGEPISSSIKSGEVYAVEPFITFRDGAGSVDRVEPTHIFSLVKTKKIKDKRLDGLRKLIMSRYGPLPFTPRWFSDKYTYEDVVKLESMKYVRGYPPMIEKSFRPVSQFEHTVIVLDGDVLVTTRV